MHRILGVTTAVTLLLGLSSTSQAERDLVISAGGDASVLLPDEEYGGERVSAGYYGRLSWETPVPAYTTRPKGYEWNIGIDPDIEFSRSWLDGSGRLSMMAAGLRLSMPFSQRRMGLLEVSARGGFWFAGRVGLAHLDDQDGTRPRFGFDEHNTSRMAPGESTTLLDLSAGEYILLGNSGLRIELEMALLVPEDGEGLAGMNNALRFRMGLGANF